MQVIDALVVTLGLDASKFTEGQKSAMEAFKKTQEQAVTGGKEFESQGKKIVDFFSTLKREALGLIGVFMGGRGIKEFVTYVTSVDAATSRTAKILNMSAKELAAWQGAAQLMGGSAQGITSALTGLSSAMHVFSITGQGPFLGVMTQMDLAIKDSKWNIKDAGQMYLEIADAAKKLNPTNFARLAANLSLIPGMNQESINLLSDGRKELEKRIATMRELNNVTKESEEGSKALQEAWVQAEAASIGLGRTILSKLTPALVSVLNTLRDIFSAFSKGGAGGEWLLRKWFPKKGEEGPPPVSATPQSGRSEREAFLRREAAARGIDPDQAVRVVMSEGKFTPGAVGDRGSSFGAFQLHYGGVASGGMAVSGLGDKFTKTTGLDARDDSTWKQQYVFALDEAKKSGWGAWHGWKGLPFAGIGGAPVGAAAAAGNISNSRGDTNTTTSQTTIGKIEVVTQATDAQGIARDIKPAMERNSFASSANYALR